MADRVHLIRGGRVICGATGFDAVADVHLEGGAITRVTTGPSAPPPEGATVIDAHGCWVMPGMIDLGVHLRDPGREHDEDLATTLRTALRGGVTTMLALPDTTPPVDGGDDVLHRQVAAQRALGAAPSPTVVVAGALTRRSGTKSGDSAWDFADIADMASLGVRHFAGDASVDAGVLRRVLEYARGAGATLVILEGPAPELAGAGVIVESAVATRLGLPGVPETADALAAWRHVEVAALAGVKLHAGALFSATALEVVVAARGRGLAVSAAAHPWHLLLDEAAHLERRYDTLLRLHPPLPTAASRAALLAAVERGDLLVSSGHRPVPNRTKELELALAEPGASGLALTLPLLCGVLSPLALARATSAGPAEVLGLADRGRVAEGARADVVVLRPDEGDIVDAALASPSAPANPWMGRRTAGRVETTIVAGRVAYQRGDKK